jgi:hypothetical protein
MAPSSGKKFRASGLAASSGCLALGCDVRPGCPTLTKRSLSPNGRPASATSVHQSPSKRKRHRIRSESERPCPHLATAASLRRPEFHRGRERFWRPLVFAPFRPTQEKAGAPRERVTGQRLSKSATILNTTFSSGKTARPVLRAYQHFGDEFAPTTGCAGVP